MFSHSEPDLDSSRFLGLLDDDIGKTGIGADRWRVEQRATVDAVRIVPENLAARRVRSGCLPRRRLPGRSKVGRSPTRDADQLRYVLVAMQTVGNKERNDDHVCSLG